jgi:hypothetical protein
MHAARQSAANVIRSNFLLCIAISFELVPKFRLSQVQVVNCLSPTQRSSNVSKVSKAKLPFKDETGAEHDLFPGDLLNIFVKTPSE